LPQALFFLAPNLDLSDKTLSEDPTGDLILILTQYKDEKGKLTLQKAVLQLIEFLCIQVPDCAALVSHYARELLAFSLKDEKVDASQHPFLQHFAFTLVFSKT
jgi:hypothetical protein